MADASEPWGAIKSFNVKVNESKLDEASPIRTWLTLSMEPEAGSPTLMLGLWLPDTHDRKKAEEYYQRAREIEKLLDGYVKAVSFQTME